MKNNHSISSFFKKLQISNRTLKHIVLHYLCFDSKRILSPQIGLYSHKDIYQDFKYCLREYSIDNNLMQPWNDFSFHKMLNLNKISIQDIRNLQSNLNKYLRDFTDEILPEQKRKKILEIQLTKLFPEDDGDEELWHKDIYRKFYSNSTSKVFYLKGILHAMKEAEVQQIDYDANNQPYYPIINKLINLYRTIDENYLAVMINFKETKKYLKKRLKNKTDEEKVRLFGSYIKKQIEKEGLEYVKFLLMYLAYSAHAIDIYMIHQIQGYKYKGAVKLYQKLFVKDYSTGRRVDFVNEFNLLSLTESSFETTKKVIQGILPKTSANLKAIKKLLREDKTYTIDNTDNSKAKLDNKNSIKLFKNEPIDNLFLKNIIKISNL